MKTDKEIGLFDLIGDVIKLPANIIKDVLGVKNETGHKSNTSESLKNIIDDI